MKHLKSLLPVVASVMFNVVGITCINYYLLQDEFTFTSALVGMVGFLIVIEPAYEKWKTAFENLFDNWL